MEEVKQEQDDSPPVIIPAISAEEAEKIILHLNKQFEEKVLKKIKKPPIPDAPAGVAPGSSGGLASTRGGGSTRGGRNLQEYLSSLKRERPKLPFLDEDSHMDLSRL